MVRGVPYWCTIGRICNRCTGCVAMTTQREREMSASALYSFCAWFVISFNVTTNFRQFKKFRTCLTSRLTTSSARTGDLVVSFCTCDIPKRSHEKAVPYVKQICLWFVNFEGVFFTPIHNTRNCHVGLIEWRCYATPHKFVQHKPTKRCTRVSAWKSCSLCAHYSCMRVSLAIKIHRGRTFASCICTP